jgi:hypothetical protein
MFAARSCNCQPAETVVPDKRKTEMIKSMLLSVAVLLSGTSLATAEPAADALATHLYAGTLNDGKDALAALPDDAGKISAQGILAFVAAIEKLGQGLHRHGLETHPGGMMMQLPVVRMPVPPNPSPEPITYEKWRGILETLLADLTAADALLAGGAKGDPKLPLDLLKIRLDLDADGKTSDAESLGGIMSAVTRQPLQEGAAPKMEFAFDKADVLWLRGYIHFLTAALQFGLAMDFEDSFNATGHAWFPRSGLPFAEALLKPTAPGMGFVDNSIGDALAFVHMMNWRVDDPARLSDARSRLAAMAGLSRESWAAARAESDDDREWLPNAKQKAAFAGLAVEDVTIDSWLEVMAEFEAILDGKKLMPHWRFDQGMNVKRLFEETKQMDLVLIIAGVGAVPYLEDGPISTNADWNRLTGAFRGSFLNYAIWFN